MSQTSEEHKGQIVYGETGMDKKGNPTEIFQVRPIYVFESPAQVREEFDEK